MIELERWATRFGLPHRLVIMKDGELVVQVRGTIRPEWETCADPANHYESREGEK